MKDYDGREGHCPFGTDAYNREGSGFENCSIIDAAKYDLEAFRTFNLGYANEPYRLDAARLPRCGTQDCVCSNSRHERLPVGGIGTATVVPDYFNSTTWALAGKKQCFYGDPKKESKLESFNEFYATYVKFDTRDLKFDFDILSEGRCR